MLRIGTRLWVIVVILPLFIFSIVLSIKLLIEGFELGMFKLWSLNVEYTVHFLKTSGIVFGS